MTLAGDGYRACIPGSYTDSPYPLQYYFEILDGACAQFFPGLGDSLSSVPYFVLTARGRSGEGK